MSEANISAPRPATRHSLRATDFMSSSPATSGEAGSPATASASSPATLHPLPVTSGEAGSPATLHLPTATSGKAGSPATASVSSSPDPRYSLPVTQPPRLEHPVRLSAQSWPEGTVPLVSIFCITYNHEKFIRDAIEGFLMQETTFPVEIFIHDDASTDGTQDIIREYAARYPKLFKLVLQTENQYSRLGNTHIYALIEKQRGKYIAMCEGDDYWTSNHKLQKQVNFLHENRESVICHHKVSYYHEERKAVFNELPELTCRKVKTDGALLARGNFIQTCTVMFRSEHARNLPGSFGKLKLGDWPQFAWLSQYGWIGYIDSNMAVYRIHGGSMWSSLPTETKFQEFLVMAGILAGCLRLRFAWPWFIHAAVLPEGQEMHRRAAEGDPVQALKQGLRLMLKAGRCRMVFVFPMAQVVLVAFLVAINKSIGKRL